MTPFYASCACHPRPGFRRRVDKLNWTTCDAALKRFSDADRELLVSLYRERVALPAAVEGASLVSGRKPDDAWTLVSRLDADIARRRELL